MPRTIPSLYPAVECDRLMMTVSLIWPCVWQVAGSYENEVAAVGVLVEAIKGVARAASPHNLVELDLHRASGAFSLTFFDGWYHFLLSEELRTYDQLGGGKASPLVYVIGGR